MHPQAILDFDATIDRNPFVGAPYAARGQSFVATNQYDKAIEDFNAALNVDNKDAIPGRGAAWPMERKGDRARRIESYHALSPSTTQHVARQGSSSCRAASRACSALKSPSGAAA